LATRDKELQMQSDNSETPEASRQEEKEMTGSETADRLEESTHPADPNQEPVGGHPARSGWMTFNRIGFTLVISGVMMLAGAFCASSTILAFIGLSFSFWGILFFFIKPARYVRASALDSTAISLYKTVDRIADDLGHYGKVFTVPPYPEDVYLPGHLRGLKEMIVLISAEDEPTMPTIEEIAKQKFILEDHKGLCITPPGLGVMSMLEDEARMDFAKTDGEDLLEVISKLITNDFELARNMEVYEEENTKQIRIEDSIFKKLYSRESRLKSVHLLGCPLVNAITCTLSKASGKVVETTKIRVSADLKTIELWCQTIEKRIQ
jgi:hypothetical protein